MAIICTVCGVCFVVVDVFATAWLLSKLAMRLTDFEDGKTTAEKRQTPSGLAYPVSGARAMWNLGEESAMQESTSGEDREVRH